MFETQWSDDGALALIGRLDASQVPKVADRLATLTTTATLDCERLDYISSAGLGALIATQRRLVDAGHTIRFRNLNRHISELFRIAGFHAIFEIE
jgi:anti-sigma B factor antagonist